MSGVKRYEDSTIKIEMIKREIEMAKLLKCKYCGGEPCVDEGVSADEVRVECVNSLDCKAWIIIYSRFKRYAVEAWNLANAKDEMTIKKSDVDFIDGVT